MKPKSLLPLILLCIMALVAACGGQPAPGPGDKSQGTASAKKTVIGVSLPEQDNPFYVAVKNWLEKEGKAAGFEMRITIANRDSAKQLADIEDFVQAKVDGIVFTPVDVVGSKAAVEAAAKAKIPVVTVVRMVEGTDVPIARIASDDVAVGRLIGEFLVKQLGDNGGNLVMLRGPAGASYANLQEKGFLEVVAKHPNVKIVAKQAHPDTRADALKLMEDLLQAQPKIDAVYGSNDEVALGVVAAVKAAKRQNVIITGGNGIQAAIDSIKAGELTYTVAKEPGKQALLAVQAMVDHLAGKQPVKDQFTAGVGVTKDNAATVDLKFLK